MADSAWVNKYIPAHASNYTKSRTANGSSITEITIHHMAGNLTVEGLGSMWSKVGRGVSSHYGVQHNNVGQYVNEADIAWCNGNWAANKRAVTIEVANSSGAPNWPIANDTLETLIKLVADIADRNSLYPLVQGQNLTWHSMYKATGCPGPYLLNRIQLIADEANKLIEAGKQPQDTDNGMYAVIKQVIALSSKEAAQEYAKQRNQETNDGFYYVLSVTERDSLIK